MRDWVDAVERAYVASVTRGFPRRVKSTDPRARAALGAIASRYLAVGTPRTLGLVADAATLADALASIEAHRAYFAPRELRATIQMEGATTTTLAEVLACDIVCVHVRIDLAAAQLRRGTHVNALAPITLDDDLRKLATLVEEEPGLGRLAAGLVDGRQLDELTVFLAGSAELAGGAL
jgi:hypothetical protein